MTCGPVTLCQSCVTHLNSLLGCWRNDQDVRWTCDQKVLGSTPGRVALKCIVATWMGDYCLWTGKAFPHTVKQSTKFNSAYHPSGAGKSSTSLSGWG